MYGNLPEFFVRDPEGNLIEAISRSVNISRRADERLDLEVSYRMNTPFGTVRPRVVYHRVLDMFDEAAPGTGEFSFFGESVGVDKYKLNANVSLICGTDLGGPLDPTHPGVYQQRPRKRLHGRFRTNRWPRTPQWT